MTVIKLLKNLNFYYIGRIMYFLLNVMAILYIMINIMIPSIYIKTLINLRNSFSNFNSNQNYYKPQTDNSINSNNNNNVSHRNSNNSLDIIDKK